MFGTQQCGVKADMKVGTETGVDSASQHQLTAMLFDGAAGTRAPRSPSPEAPQP